MSSERGNVARSRAQKHTNKRAFKNDLHDTTPTIKHTNSLEINNVCAHCKGVIEWKIKYKKYKPLKAAASCVKCHQKTVKHSYHTMCLPCSNAAKVCPKCLKSEALVPPTVAAFDDSFMRTGDVQDTIKGLSERRRRTFNRFVKKVIAERAGVTDSEVTAEEEILAKLKEMSLSSGKNDLFFDELDDDFGDDCSDEECSDDEG